MRELRDQQPQVAMTAVTTELNGFIINKKGRVPLAEDAARGPRGNETG